MTEEEIKAYFDELEESLQDRFQRVYQALPAGGKSGREPTDLHTDLWFLWKQAQMGLQPRLEKSLSKTPGPKTDLKQQVLISAVDYVVSLGLSVSEIHELLFGPSKISTSELLDGTLTELEKYDERYQQGGKGSPKTVGNLLGDKQARMRFMIYCEARELIHNKQRLS